MPTPAERKALLFLAGVIVLGASVRVVRAARDGGNADAATRQALARQLAAVDSARRDDDASNRARPSKRGGAGKRRGRTSSRGAPDSLAAARRDSMARAARARRDSSEVLATPVDLDVAGEAEIERLPRIGPVLARRIIEDRTANGAFGSLTGFERVRGIGPALAAALGPRVTFSGTARPSNALVDQRLRSSRASAKSPRRERRN